MYFKVKLKNTWYKIWCSQCSSLTTLKKVSH